MPAVPTNTKPSTAAPARRFTDKPDLDPSAVWGLPAGHLALKTNRTLFPSTVVDVDEKFEERLLVSGENSRKLGKTVAKGKFKGYALYGLTLEERATCATDCSARAFGYGNGMQLARRHRIVDMDLFAALIEDEIREILETEPGLLVRLHVLGDFPSAEYVGLWADMLDDHSSLACYGYTHWSETSEIGKAIASIKQRFPDRFRIRWSDDVALPDSAIIINEIPEGPRFKGALVCPAQTDATACCASCGMCWEGAARKEAIAFIRHGRRSLEVAAAAATAKAAEPDPAFAKLVVAATPKLKRFALKLCRDKSRADDLVQDTMFKGLRNEAQFQPGSNIDAWLITIMRNHFMSERRKDGREVGDPEGFIIGNAVSRDAQDDALEAKEGLAAFERLPPEQREAMRDIASGMSYEDAAEKHGVPAGTVKSRVARGREALRGLTSIEAEPISSYLETTIRKITALPSGGGVPAALVGQTPAISVVNPRELLIETAYQRDLSGQSIKLIRKILTQWDWTKFKPPICAKSDAGLFVIDGQHTAIAASSHPGIQRIPVLIVQAQNIGKRAAAFVSHNRDRLNMTPAQIFYGDLAAGDAATRRIMETCAKVGASIPRLPVARGYWKMGQIAAVGELRSCYRSLNASQFERVLRLAVQSRATPISKLVLRAFREVIYEPKFALLAGLPDTRLIAAMSSIQDLDNGSLLLAAETGQSRYRAAAVMLERAAA